MGRALASLAAQFMKIATRGRHRRTPRMRARRVSSTVADAKYRGGPTQASIAVDMSWRARPTDLSSDTSSSYDSMLSLRALGSAGGAYAPSSGDA